MCNCASGRLIYSRSIAYRATVRCSFVCFSPKFKVAGESCAMHSRNLARNAAQLCCLVCCGLLCLGVSLHFSLYRSLCETGSCTSQVFSPGPRSKVLVLPFKLFAKTFSKVEWCIEHLELALLTDNLNDIQCFTGIFLFGPKALLLCILKAKMSRTLHLWVLCVV